MNTTKKGRKPGITNAESLALATPEFKQCAKKARELGISMQQLAQLAGVPWGTMQSWRRRYSPRHGSTQLQDVLSVTLESDDAMLVDAIQHAWDKWRNNPAWPEIFAEGEAFISKTMTGEDGPMAIAAEIFQNEVAEGTKENPDIWLAIGMEMTQRAMV